MHQIKELIRRNQLSLFFILAYALSWWSAPFSQGQLIPHGPFFAALILLALTAGRAGLSALWRQMTHWRVPAWWYALAPALIVAYQGLAALVAWLLFPKDAAMLALPSAGLLLELLLLGGMWEEPGWTGYALPRLQQRFASHPQGELIASLVTGLFRAIWHVPLAVAGHIPWLDVFIFIMAFQLIISWIYNRTKGSVLVVMWFHLCSNVLGAIFNPLFTGSGRLVYQGLFFLLSSVVALLLTFAVNRGSQVQENAPA
jgi:uncharacterized protein